MVALPVSAITGLLAFGLDGSTYIETMEGLSDDSNKHL